LSAAVEEFLRAGSPEAEVSFKSAARSLFADFRGRAGRAPDEHEEQELLLWLAGEWVSVAAFASARAGATFASVAELLRSEFERGAGRAGRGGVATAVSQEST